MACFGVYWYSEQCQWQNLGWQFVLASPTSNSGGRVSPVPCLPWFKSMVCDEIYPSIQSHILQMDVAELYTMFNGVFFLPALCRLWGCKNRTCSGFWLEVGKMRTKPGLNLSRQLRQFFLFVICVSGVCSVLFPCLCLSVPVQLIAWKDSKKSPKWPIMCRVGH